MKRISLEKISMEQVPMDRSPMELVPMDSGDYGTLYEYILREIAEGRLKPVKASGTNGKKPALYREYWIVEPKKDDSLLEEELSYRLVPQISNDYYMRHLSEYEKDREFVLQLDGFLRSKNVSLSEPASVNERSYEIWHREKFLKEGQGKKILKRCGIDPADLNYYETSEPFAYYAHSRETPQNLLILENKDTFYSMRSHLLRGKHTVCGIKIDTLVYGAGKGILRSFLDFELCAEPYMAEKGNTIYYFGDLDYEGIGIFENLAKLMEETHAIIPFVPAYEAMLGKAFTEMPWNEEVSGKKETLERYHLPRMKEGQNTNLTGFFFTFFEETYVSQMRQMLSSGFYIPQEILNQKNF